MSEETKSEESADDITIESLEQSERERKVRASKAAAFTTREILAGDERARVAAKGVSTPAEVIHHETVRAVGTAPPVAASTVEDRVHAIMSGLAVPKVAPGNPHGDPAVRAEAEEKSRQHQARLAAEKASEPLTAEQRIEALESKYDKLASGLAGGK